MIQHILYPVKEIHKSLEFFYLEIPLTEKDKTQPDSLIAAITDWVYVHEDTVTLTTL